MLKEWPPPPYLVDAACLRPHYVVCRGLSITREVLLLLVGLANFLRQLIPADAIAHAGAQLPLEQFRLGIDPGPELIEPLADSAGVDVELAGGVAHATRIELEGPVQSPVLGRQAGEVGRVDGIVVMVGDRVIEQQRGGVDEVLHVDLIDLQLAEQQVRWCQRRPLVPEAVGQLDDVAHLHPVDEYVDLSAVHTVEVEEALIPIERVEAAVALVAERLEELLYRRTVLGGSDEIEVAVFARQRRLPGTRTVKVDGGAAHQPYPDPCLRGSGPNPLRLGAAVRHRD